MLKAFLLRLPLVLAYTVAEVLADLAGLVVVAALAFTSTIRVRLSDVWPLPVRIGGELKGGLQVQWPRWAWLWSNEEDGVVGPSWYAARHPTWSGSRTAFYWSALRNPSNNMRFIPVINPVIDPKRVRYYDTTVRSHGDGFVQGVTVTWQGPFVGLLALFYFRGSRWRFWWGWKLKPEDAAGVPDNDMRKVRCGFATQFKRIT